MTCSNGATDWPTCTPPTTIAPTTTALPPTSEVSPTSVAPTTIVDTAPPPTFPDDTPPQLPPITGPATVNTVYVAPPPVADFCVSDGVKLTSGQYVEGVGSGQTYWNFMPCGPTATTSSVAVPSGQLPATGNADMPIVYGGSLLLALGLACGLAARYGKRTA